VTDRSTKTPFDPSLKLAAAVKSAAFDHGLICYPMAGTRDGVQGDHVLLAPPFIIDDHQIDELVDKLDQAVRDCLPA
jgi:adenosylmethionine-8-amino-7-oxononanoate aminotransferase